MKFNFYNLLILTGFFLTCSIIIGCNIFDPPAPIPGYFRLNTPVLITGAIQGSSSQNITNAWVYVDGQAIGVYNAEGTFPVIAQGKHVITLLAGVEEDGVSNLRVIYPFYTSDTLTENIEPNKDNIINPVYKYLSSTIFSFIDNFDHGTDFVNEADSSANPIKIVSQGAFQGNSGRIILDTAFQTMQLQTNQAYTLPTNGAQCYLEMNYKTDVTLNVGLLDDSTGLAYYEWNINPKSYWNKIYLNMNDVIPSTSASTFKILISASYNPNEDTTFIYLDNIKLLHL